MPRRLLALLAAALCSVALAAPPARAQAPAGTAAAASGAAAPGLPQTLPLKREDPGSTSSSGFMAGAFLLVLLAAAAVLVLRRGRLGVLQRWQTGRPTAGAGVARLASQALTPQASIHVVRWSDEELLLACTAQHVTVIARRPLSPVRGDGA